MKRILALGGGGFLLENRHSPIDRYIVSLTAKVRPRICFVSTPSGDLPESIDRFYEAYGALDCEPFHLAFFRNPTPGAIALTGIADTYSAWTPYSSVAATPSRHSASGVNGGCRTFSIGRSPQACCYREPARAHCAGLRVD